jgi:hypothetical protein
MSLDAQAAALRKMDAAFARQTALIDQIGVDAGPTNEGNLAILQELFVAQQEFRAAAAEYRAAGGE